MLIVSNEALQWNERLVLRPRDDLHVRMAARSDLLAGRAMAARLQSLGGDGVAQQSLGELEGERPLADTGRTDEQKGARQASARQGPAELLDDAIVSEDFLPGHLDC